LEVTVPAVRGNVAVVAPADTVTLVGIVSAALLLDKVTGKALVAALLSVTVQVVVRPDRIVVGAQAIELSCGGAMADTVKVLEAPPADAVITELRFEAIVPTVAVKVLVVAPAAIGTDRGATMLAFALVMEATKPPTGAAPLSVIVHVELPGALILEGLQLSVLKLTVGRTTAMDPPAG